MGIASVVHLYVFPSKPYELMGDRIPGSVAVLGDYASVDCPLDPDEVRDSERPTKLRLPQPESDNVRSGMTIRESVRDVFVGGGEYVSFLQPFCQFKISNSRHVNQYKKEKKNRTKYEIFALIPSGNLEYEIVLIIVTNTPKAGINRTK